MYVCVLYRVFNLTFTIAVIAAFFNNVNETWIYFSLSLNLLLPSLHIYNY